DKETAPSIVGAWKWEKAVSEDDEFTVDEGVYLEISSDGTVNEFYQEGDVIYLNDDATYTYTGNTLTLSRYLLDDGIKASVVKFIGNDTIEIEITDGETDYVLTLSRADISGFEKVFAI